MDEILEEFVAEIREMLESIGSTIVAWEAHPQDRDKLDAIFRFFHTVKGNCGFFDFPRLEALSHAAEGALADVRSGEREPDAKLVSAVLATVDRIAAMVDGIDNGKETDTGDDSGLIAALAPDGADTGGITELSEDAILQVARTTNLRSVRLPVDLLDRVMSGVSDIVLARNELARRLRELPEDTPLIGHFDRLSALISEVRERMTQTRMQPIDTLFTSFPRLVRDLAQQLGKEVLLDCDSGDVELDREMIELVRDPLIHIIRNAIDHGIESPAERAAQGKHGTGLLQIAARQSGNQILVQINDDGRGIDTDRIVAKCIAAGILTEAQAAGLSPAERHMLICEAGLSTADTVTEISGRGVGMDVVRANIEQLGGSITIDSLRGEGTRIALRLPLTLSITPSLIVEAGGQKFAIPRSYVKEVVDLRSDAVRLSEVGDTVQVRIRDKQFACLRLADLLGLEADETRDISPLAVIRLPGGDIFTLRVDKLLDHEELVIKPLAPSLMATGLYAGTTLTDDGDLILLLDVMGIAKAGGLALDMGSRVVRAAEDEAPQASSAEEVQIVIFTGLDGKQRALRMAVVERIENGDREKISRSAGGDHIVLDNAIFPLAGIASGLDTLAGKLRMLRLNDGGSSLAYACVGHTDIIPVPMHGTSTHAAAGVERILLIDGKPVELLDAHAIFARYGSTPERLAKPLCRLPVGDPWMQQFLRPLIESAGYQVIDDTHEAKADIAICELGAEAPAAAARAIIRVGASAEECAADPHAIYRYDREALLAALGAARRAQA
ncbi:chemotaxis protein CheA [Erythrobacter sp. EC-HK427]|uniref:chemotaxis protein CheA n=1 Tax=Erythrobacter sp. EC-HK427 TaxID=2038396 RepID=UPI00125137F3|nr:chemotaxis protein CheW [Erythrobacter sp. EC-HK427]VVT00034.1 Chemotaxis protein CheA [Erythrobacter sp. EC-HK427]